MGAVLLLNYKQKFSESEKACSLPVSLKRRPLRGSGRREGITDSLGMLSIKWEVSSDQTTGPRLTSTQTNFGK